MNRKIRQLYISAKIYIYIYRSTNVSSKHEVYKAICENAQLPIRRPGEKGKGQQKHGGREMDKRRDTIKCQKKEQGAEICKLGVKGTKKQIYTYMFFVLHEAPAFNTVNCFCVGSSQPFTMVHIHLPQCIRMNETRD